MSWCCPRCQNQSPALIGYIQGQPYCRACLEFVDEPWTPQKVFSKSVTFELPYPLTHAQRILSEQLLQCYHKRQSVMIDAVTGSGKTELVYHLLHRAIEEGKRVGVVIPRTDVVKELLPRFQRVFPHLKIVSLYGGHHQEKEGDLIILTTHQIYRYVDYFDVLVFDEVDAFPYRDNPTLKAFVTRAVKGMVIYLSATFSQETLQAFLQSGGQVYHLFHRHHGYPLPTIQLKQHPYGLKWLTLLWYLKQWMRDQKKVFIFVPTIALGKKVFAWVQLFYPTSRFAYSESWKRHQDVAAFKDQEFNILITTSILERGITLSRLQVVIFQADHPLMNAATLIQMAGRVGRKKEDPEGDVIALVDQITPDLQAANAKIHFANQHL